MPINEAGILVTKKHIKINAPISHVWNIQTDINNWPKWQKNIKYAKLNGELKEGSTFNWKANGIKIKSTLQEVTPNEVIEWIGVAGGIEAIHRWSFSEEAQKTVVHVEESISGWLAFVIKLIETDFLDESVESSLKILKQHSEKTFNNK